MRWHLPKKNTGLKSTGSLPWLRKIISSGHINGKEGTEGKSTEKKKQQHNPLKQVFFTEHALSPDQLADIYPLARIDSSNLLASRGISQEEACLRLIERRRLQNPHPKFRTFLSRLLRSLLHQFLHSFRLLLFFSTLLCFAYFLLNATSLSFDAKSNALWLAILQFVALFAICLVAVAQKFQMKRLNNKAFSTVLPSADIFYTAIREGRRSPVRCNEILDGELLLLKAGQRVPADLRLLHILDGPFLVDCAWLAVGPAMEPMEFTANVASKHVDVFKARNVVFAGFLCTQGSALGLVIRTNKKTLFSRLSARPVKSTTTNNENIDSTTLSSSYDSNMNISTTNYDNNGIHHLEMDYLQLVHWICWISLCISFLFYLAALFLLGTGPFTVDPFAAFVCIFLVLLIANLPQGLPLAFNAQLLLIARQLRQKYCGEMMLKDMHAADSLSRTSVLMIHNPSVFCTNRPSLTDLWFGGSNQQLCAANLIDWAVRSNKKPQQIWELHEKDGFTKQSEFAERFGQQTLELLKTAAFCCKATSDKKKHSPPKLQSSESQRRRSLTFWESLRRPSLNMSKCSRVTDITTEHPLPTIVSEKTIPKPLFIGNLTYLPQLHQGKSTPIGTPIDVALLKFLEQLMPMDLWKSGMELLPQESTNQLIGNLTDWRTPVITIGRRIESDNNSFSDGLAINGDGLQYRLMARGAPEELLRNCTTVRTPMMEELPLTDELLLQFEEQFLYLSASGKHCTGIAILDFSETECPPYTFGSAASSSSSTSALSSDEWTEWATNSQMSGGWCFLGMLVFADSLHECAQSVEQLKKDGIRTVLMSDDHPAVVQALAQKSNLINTSNVIREDKKQKQQETRAEVLKSTIQTKIASVKNLQQLIPSHIRSPFRRLHKTQSTTSSGYHSTEINASSNNDNTDGKHENHSKTTDEIASFIEEGWPIDGDFFAEMDSDQINYILTVQPSERNLLFTRLNPDQIGQLVKHFQAFGNSVTFVSQNGLVDGQALRDNDFGIAPTDCSVPGSLLAQQMAVALCSDMSLSNLVRAICLSRTIRRNLASTLIFSLSHTPAILLPIFLTLVLGFPPGLNPLQILSIVLLTAIPPAVALAFNRTLYFSSTSKANDTPLSKGNRLGIFLYSYLLAGIVLAAGPLFAYLDVFWQAGIDISQLINRADLLFWEQQSDTAAKSSTNATLLLTTEHSNKFAIQQKYEEENQLFEALTRQAAAAWQLTLVTAQLFHVWLCADLATGSRKESAGSYPWAIFRNFALWFAIVFDLSILLILIYLPGFNVVFLGVQPPPVHIWLFPLVVGCVLFIIHLLRKLILHERWRRSKCDKINTSNNNC